MTCPFRTHSYLATALVQKTHRLCVYCCSPAALALTRVATQALNARKLSKGLLLPG